MSIMHVFQVIATSAKKYCGKWSQQNVVGMRWYFLHWVYSVHLTHVGNVGSYFVEMIKTGVHLMMNDV